MRFLSALLFVFALCGISTAQQRFVVSPNQEVIPIPPGSSAQELIARRSRPTLPSNIQAPCSGEAVFGYDPVHFPVDSRFGFSHKDVLGEWFVAPARGTIDTFYFYPNGSISAIDSEVIIRVLKSNLSPGHGPGYDYPPPCRSWGYWFSSVDQENSITPFLEDATDTTWHSTIELNGGTKPSFPPAGLSVWGLSGIPIKLKPNSINAVPTDLIPGGFQIKPHAPSVQDTIDVGEAFFFTLRMNSINELWAYPDPMPTEFAASSSGDFPARDWKFYEHDSGPTWCSGTPASQIKKGWVARGPLGPAPYTSGSAFSVWYVMTPSTNIPPSIYCSERLDYTFSTDPRTVTADIVDCDAEQPPRAGVYNQYIRYWTRDLAGYTLSSGTVPMYFLGGSGYSGTIPSAPRNTIVTYRIFASDSTGLTDSTCLFRYRVVDLNSSYYKADTTLSCTTMSISGTGTAIGASAWFLPPTSSNNHAGDDGTAGPFSLGGTFLYFGDTMNYAWVGVNGAIALSKTAIDTLDVNANGLFTDAWELPSRQCHGRQDLSGQIAGLIPRNFIAPFWGNWIVKQDSPAATFGNVRYSSTAFPGKFIVEWDSLGDFGPSGALPDDERFRVILDRISGTIQFQYDNVGSGGVGTADLVGLQSDSITHPGPITPFNFFDKDGYPLETRLHNGLCLSYYPCDFSVALVDGWNLVSVGVRPPSYAKSFLFPMAVTPAYAYHGGYTPTNILDSMGGYWIKVSGAQTICVPGTCLTCRDDTLRTGWNIIGAGCKPVNVGTLVTTPPAIIASPIFGFSGSYTVVSTLVPGHAYWLRSNAPGVLHICGGAASTPKETAQVDELSGLDKVTIRDEKGRAQTLYVGSDAVMGADEAARYEMPPAAPDETFGVRFSSGRLVEVYPSTPDMSKEYEYPIALRDVAYPIRVSWDLAGRSKGTLALTAVRGKERKTLTLLGGTKGETGSVRIIDPAVTKLILKLTQGVALPKEFALSQNYPNPFNPITQFIVDVPKASDVEIAVYDILGREIVTLMRGEQEAGYHTVEWNSKDSRGLTVPSGMYIVRMTAGDFSASRKVLLLK